MVMFGTGGRHPHGVKDSITNIEETGEFVCNLTTWETREQMSLSSSSTPAQVDEFDFSGLEAEPAVMVTPPQVKASPIHLECTYHETIELPTDDPDPLARNAMVIGTVVGIHISDAVLTEGMVDMSKFRPIARMGYMDYAVVDNVFTMLFPD